ncbi:MAG: murein hydrolase activator EnvC [Candidatus Dormibacteria bacterium]
MRHRLLYVLAILTVATSIAPSLPVRADDLDAKQQQQQDLNNSIGHDQARIKQLQGQQAVAQAQLDMLHSQIAGAEAEIAAENGRLDALIGQVEKTQKDLDATREHLAQRETVLRQRTRSLYKTGGDVSFIDSLFTSSTFSQLLDRFIVMRDVTHADQLLVQQIQADKVSVEGLLARQSQQRDEQKAVVIGIRQKQDALRGQYVQEAALKGQLAAQQLSLEARAAASARALVAVGAEIAALVAARSRAHSSGTFAWPDAQGPITQTFGCTDFGGEPPPPSGYACKPAGSCHTSTGCFHTGIDIAAPYGSEVTATDGGIAYTYAGSSGYGNHIIVVHANGYSSLYGHLASFAVASGAQVAKGDRIGIEGSTGFSTGPHLHFEIRLNDAVEDPCRFVGC